MDLKQVLFYCNNRMSFGVYFLKETNYLAFLPFECFYFVNVVVNFV